MDSNDPSRKRLAEVPAMDLEKRAEQLAAQEFTANNGDPALSTTEAIGLWAQLDGSTKSNFRENARRELAEEAKRRGDHDEMRRLHDLGQAVTGAAVTGVRTAVSGLTPALASHYEWSAAIEGLLKLIDSVCPSEGEYGLNGGLATMGEVELTQTEEYLRQAADRVKRATIG